MEGRGLGTAKSSVREMMRSRRQANNQALELYEPVERMMHLRASTINRYNKDQSGTKEYRFNSLGFRGEDVDPTSEHRIFVAGCSLTFGDGLDLAETWPFRFREKYAARQGCPPPRVNLLNFSVSGASNDRIVHTVLPQCSVVRPDLLLVQFTYSNRTEYLHGSDVSRIGPWMDLQLDPSGVTKIGDEKPRVSDLEEAALYYYGFYTQEWGLASTLRNILLVQSYCKAHGIPQLCWWVHDLGEEMSRCSGNRVCKVLHDLVDLAHFCDVPLELLEVDRAADDIHPGPRAHHAIADWLFARYEALAAGEAHGKNLRATDGSNRATRAWNEDAVLSTMNPGGQTRTWSSYIKSRIGQIRQKVAGIRKRDRNIYPLY